MADDFIDSRIVRLGIQIGSEVKFYEGLDIVATGTKYANANQNECTVNISNLEKNTRNYILTETSPFNKDGVVKRVILEAGRLSYGAAQIYQGDIIQSSIGQPPDIQLTLKSLTANSQKGNVVARSGGDKSSLRNLAQIVASDIGVTLDFQAKDKDISSYSFTGSALKQVNKLGDTGMVDAYVDDGVLIVKDRYVPLSGTTRVLNKNSGMIGIPELTEQGIKATFLLDNQTRIGGGITIESDINPALNGTYTIYKLGFSITSRQEPFYWIAEATRRT